ncbi:uncharacterized protein AC631_03309 [Debaryomyces fabryi]|uniref:37S ribosomal protein S28, mitochondrial n=1 Tax=Debaryomyces fabryi TaxID=58627 RepID=A0A0V1PXD1_9ASCO|nr:uncharacterized protein AC631_03309 [Debaryomyces fabryi]KSA00939.1 hypothetical protein AC631_03309 [Debaryomyces fabryi]CUM52386.1 unnamed protein product [Debaryomyces fabryi]
MFQIGCRLFSTGRPVFNAVPQKIQPILAAKQFIPDQATRSKVKSLRRKEARLKRQIVRDVNNVKKHSLENVKFQVDPVLGDENNAFIKRVRAELQEPTNLAYGYKRDEFEKLLYGAEKANIDRNSGSNILHDSISASEERKKRALLTILNIKNTNAQDRKTAAIQYAREEFQREEGDTGSPEVQAAVLTVRIHLGMDHVKQFFKDKEHIQHVRQMVQQRQKILKYLKRDNAEQYYYTIAKLGLTDDVITREFNMGRQYLQDYKVWGDKQLIKLSDKQKKKEAQIVELQKRVIGYNQLAKRNYEEIERLSESKR